MEEFEECQNILNKLTDDILRTYPPAAQWIFELWQEIKNTTEKDVVN